MSKTKICTECGGTVSMQDAGGKEFLISKNVMELIPNGFLLPTCESCGEVFTNYELDAKIYELLSYNKITTA